jgi:hypothetical protein
VSIGNPLPVVVAACCLFAPLASAEVFEVAVETGTRETWASIDELILRLSLDRPSLLPEGEPADHTC